MLFARNLRDGQGFRHPPIRDRGEGRLEGGGERTIDVDAAKRDHGEQSGRRAVGFDIDNEQAHAGSMKKAPIFRPAL